MKYKTVKEVKKEIEEEAELVASGVGLLVLFGVYIFGMLISYLVC